MRTLIIASLAVLVGVSAPSASAQTSVGADVLNRAVLAAIDRPGTIQCRDSFCVFDTGQGILYGEAVVMRHMRAMVMSRMYANVMAASIGTVLLVSPCRSKCSPPASK